MNKLARTKRKSLHEGRVGRHKGSCCTESEASMAGTGSVGVIGARGVISSEEESVAIGGKRSSGNGGMFGSPYFSQRQIQRSYGYHILATTL